MGLSRVGPPDAGGFMPTAGNRVRNRCREDRRREDRRREDRRRAAATESSTVMATTPIPTDINTAESGGRRRLPFSGRLVMAFTFFSMFFGAGRPDPSPLSLGRRRALPPFPPSSGSSSRRSAFRFSACSPSRSRVASTSSPWSRVPGVRLAARRGDHAHHRPVLRHPTHGDHVIRDDGGAIPALPHWMGRLDDAAGVLAGVLRRGFPAGPASRETRRPCWDGSWGRRCWRSSQCCS